MKDFKIIAGPCSLSGAAEQMAELLEIGSIQEVDAVRCCGMKSVTSPRSFMGVDKDWFLSGRFGTPPSFGIARKVLTETGKAVAFEMMDIEQLYPYDEREFDGKLFVWNAAINQLGWPIWRASKIAASNRWGIGLKNPKWSGDKEVEINGQWLDNGEKNWMGNAKFAEDAGVKPVLIQRGIEGYDKFPFRNLPNHAASMRMKALGYDIYFDPSHAFGKALRDEIVERTLHALELRSPDTFEEYLYSGILIEVGSSQTDTDQHISIKELRRLIDGIKRLRNI